MKLTPARRKALEWFRDNDGAKMFPIGITKRVMNVLLESKFLREERPPFGFSHIFITPAGRAALEREVSSNE